MIPPAPTQSLPLDTPPDWSTTSEEILCPLCTYNLRGLTIPRCPECGYFFTWSTLQNARLTLHPYLFEHHPDRNIRSFFRTSFAGFLPRRFWSRLTAAHPIHSRRLIVYWVLTFFPFAIILTAAISLNVYLHYHEWFFDAQQMIQSSKNATPGTQLYENWQDIIRRYGSVHKYIDRYYTPHFIDSIAAIWNEYRSIAIAYVMWILWPLATAAALLSYRRSMRQAAIRPIHILRCVLYSTDLIFWPSFLLLCWLAWIWASYIYDNLSHSLPALGFRHRLPDWTFPWTLWTWHAAVLLATYRLTIAYSRYLRFQKSWLAVPLASVASLLFLWILYLAFSGPSALTQLPL